MTIIVILTVSRGINEVFDKVSHWSSRILWLPVLPVPISDKVCVWKAGYRQYLTSFRTRFGFQKHFLVSEREEPQQPDVIAHKVWVSKAGYLRIKQSGTAKS